MQRRELLGISAGALTTALAGCASGSSNSGDSGNSSPSAGATNETTNTEETTSESDSGSYSVSMEPVGEVSFESAPETWVANNGSWADMGVALGLEPPKGVWLTDRYHTQYYDEIPDVSVDKSGMVSLYQDGVSKERFYELDADVHVVDPHFLMNRFKGWKQKDVDEISEKVGPFFGNSIFSRGYPWHEDYTYYTLYEAFEKMAQLSQQTERYEAFSTLHDEFQSKVSDVVPSSNSERPTVAIVWAAGNQPETFSPYLISEGTSFKQWRDLKVRDAFAETDVRDFHADRGKVDYETLLEIDPDVLLCRGHENQTAKEFQNTVVSFMKNHETASALTAVENGDVYRGGPLYQGPITNFVVTQRAAEQIYGVDEKLYDPQRVADIVNGNN
jgi:iron complex transport system substrate-binding protein